MAGGAYLDVLYGNAHSGGDGKRRHPAAVRARNRVLFIPSNFSCESIEL